jgi:hypothetical protein
LRGGLRNSVIGQRIKFIEYVRRMAIRAGLAMRTQPHCTKSSGQFIKIMTISYFSDVNAIQFTGKTAWAHTAMFIDENKLASRPTLID